LRGVLSIGPFEVTRLRGGRGSLWGMLLVLVLLRFIPGSAPRGLAGARKALALIHTGERHRNRVDVAVFGLGILRPDTPILFTPERTCNRRWIQAKRYQRRRPAQQIVDGSAPR
jgi:hypothetical protein